MIHPTRTNLLLLKDKSRSVVGSMGILKARKQALIKELLAATLPFLRSREDIPFNRNRVFTGIREMLRSRLLFYFKTMPLAVALPLAAYRVLRLVLNTLVHLLTVGLTLGLHRGQRDKLGVYATELAWLLLGCPDHWGLPGKCPRRDAGPMP